MPEIIEAPHSIDAIQHAVLDSIALGESLSITLDKACTQIETTLGNAICCVMQLDHHTNALNVVAGPSLPQDVRDALNGLVPGPNAASCGTAAFTGKPVIVEDTTKSPYWVDYQDNVKKYGIGSCWSYPILSVGSDVSLGTFAICHADPATPNATHYQMLETASQLAGIAIQREESDLTLRRTQEALVEIARDVTGEFGRGFLKTLAARLAEVLNVDYVLIAERSHANPEKASTIAVIADGQPIDNFEFELEHTPCNEVLVNDIYRCPKDIQTHFLKSSLLAELDASGYMGIILRDSNHQPTGWISVLHRNSMELSPLFENIFRAFAVRAAAELERARVESELRDSEARYRRLYDMTPVMMHSIDREGRIVSANEQWLKTMGYEADEVLGKPSARFHTERSGQSAVETWLPRLLAGEVCRDIPFEFVTKDGRVVQIRLSASIETGSTPAAFRAHAMSLDVTSQREIEAEVERLNTALENALQGIAQLDKDGRYIMVRAGYANALGYEVDELIGQSWEITVPPDKWEKTRRAAEVMFEHGKVEVENTGIRKDGSLFHKQCLFVRSLDNRGEYNGFYCFMKDITQRVEAQEARQTLEEQLRQSQKLDAVGTLASGVAHDINNSLTAVFGFAGQARKQMSDPAALDRSIEMVERAAEQASSVTRSLLTFAQKAASAKEPVRLDQLATESMQLLRRLIPASITLVQETDADAPVWIDADVNQMQQVLMNLTINARDAMPNGGTFTVRVQKGDQALLIIEDTGDGMTPDIQQRIFEPFFTTKQRGQGTGLGLSVVHGIIRDHQGHIAVQSSPDTGTRFEIQLPLTNQNPQNDPVDSVDALPALTKGESKRILVAEDDEFVGAVIVAALESEGYDVVLSRDGNEAMASFESHRDDADMVILDLDLPGRSGDECKRHIREQRADLPILIVTGNADAYLTRHQSTADKEHTSKKGDASETGENILAKPFKMDQLLEEVRSLLV